MKFCPDYNLYYFDFCFAVHVPSCAIMQRFVWSLGGTGSNKKNKKGSAMFASRKPYANLSF